jgi:hypothetical protein
MKQDYLLMKEIEKKFGKEVTRDPNSNLPVDKEEQINNQLLELERKRYSLSKESKEYKQNLFLEEPCRYCNKKIAKSFLDRVYIKKYKSCYDCYIKHNP